MANEVQAVAQSVVAAVQDQVRRMAQETEVTTGVAVSPARLDRVLEAAERTVTQDAWQVSRRVWSAGLGLVTAVLALPEVQALLLERLGDAAGEWAPVVTAGAAAGLAAWSKLSDPRAQRGISG